MATRLFAIARLVVIGVVCLLVAVLRGSPTRRMRPVRFPRTVTVGAVLCALASATIALAAGQQTSQAPATPIAAPPKPTILTVPDVRGQTYVFAKGMLEDAGFAWQVTGPVDGYATNAVASQTPAPDTQVFDTGFPTVTLGLTKSSEYREAGAPANSSPYTGTPLEPVGEAASAAADRSPAFAVKGAPKESADQPSLPERADALAAWLETHRKPTRANVSHWRYEHAWIVAGARFGWWGGAEALQKLVRVDRRVEDVWGIGKQRRLTAKRVLDEVRAQTR